MGPNITQLRSAFNIPDAVTIIPAVAANRMGVLQTKFEKSKIKFDVPAGNPVDAPLYSSPLNTPVYTNVEMGVKDGKYESNIEGIFIQVPSVKYEAVLMTVSQSKNIVTTSIQGRDGTVKEYVGMSDYTVQINGIITGTNGHHPTDEIAALRKILVAPVALDLTSYYLQNLGIVSGVVTDFELEQQAGGFSYQTFSITMISDIPQELRLSNV